MPKKWGVATAALAAVKGKKLASKKLQKEKEKKDSSSSSDGSYYSSDDDGSSYSSDGSNSTDLRKAIEESKNTSGKEQKPRQNVTKPGRSYTAAKGDDGSVDSSDSSSYGCGTYHRRESLSPSSSVDNDDESSPVDDDDDESSYSSGSEESSGSSYESSSASSASMDSSKGKESDHSNDGKTKSQTESKPSVKVAPAKTASVKKETPIEVDEKSEASSKASSRKSSSVSTKSSKGGREKNRARGEPKRDKPNQKIEEDDAVEDKFSNLLQRVRSQKQDWSEGKEQTKEDGEGEEKFNALLEKVRNQKDSSAKSKLSTSGLAGMSTQSDNSNKTQTDSDGEPQKQPASEARDAKGELTYSLKTELLANANSNLRSSVTTEEKDSQNKDAGSSRFASMMANLKSSNDSEKPPDKSNGEEDTGSDDEHMFEAPKIVNEQGQSMRSAKSNENHSSDSGRERKIKKDDTEDEGKRSRFQLPSPSLKKAEDKNDKKEAEQDDDEAPDAFVQYPSDHDDSSDDDSDASKESDPSKESDASVSTESSGDDQNAGRVTNDARQRYPEEDEENSSDEDMESEYYDEPAMTILTPITEMGSIEESDGEESESESDEGTPDPKGKEKSKQGKQQNDNPVVNLPEVIKRVKTNDPDFDQIKLDNRGLNDFDVAKLLYSLHENTHVTHVSLANNKLGDGSAVSLAQILTVSKTISFVNLRGNSIGNKGALALRKSLKSNDTVVHLDINDNDIDSYVMEGLQKYSVAIVSLDVSDRSTQNDLGKKKAQVNTPEEADNSKERKLEHDPKSCSLLKFFDDNCVSSEPKNQKTFKKKCASAQESRTKSPTEVALLLSMSLALTSIDSKWILKGTSEESPELIHCTLGDRAKINSEQGSYAATHVSNSHRKVSKSLQNMTSSKWKESFSNSASREKIRRLSEEMELSDANKLSLKAKAKSHPPKHQQWTSSFIRLDPRWQIRNFFNDMSVFGSVLNDTQSDVSAKSAIFTVWRPTSSDAISKMMRGDGVGKGLEIKGKSAKKGDLSGYIPFLQINQEEHKKQIRTIPKEDRTKIFFNSRDVRDKVGEYLGKVSKELTLRVAQAKFSLARAKNGCDPNATFREELNYAAKSLSYEVQDPKVVQNDDYAPDMYCIEVSCRVLWEGLVERKDITRSPGSKFDTGRASQPAYQDMNFGALRRRKPGEPLPVLYQISEDDPFDARTLVMAYEEEGKVSPVVSDFDCFLIGSKNFSYEDKMPPEQVDLLHWCVSNIEWILSNHAGPESWTSRWLEVLKDAARNGFYPSMPRCGFGDPTSYSMIEASVHRSAKTCGAVRHGPECFNYYFPQELDEKFLIIFSGSEMWKHVNEKELIQILREKVKEGFTFPLNPKWLLCDPGWITLFQDLLDSKNPNVQSTIDLWFPPESGLRERILDINKRFPNGFQQGNDSTLSQSLAEEEYERYLILQRARKKMRGFVYWRNLLLDVRKRAASSIDDNCINTVDEFQHLFNEKKKNQLAKANDVEDMTLKEICKVDFFDRNGGK